MFSAVLYVQMYRKARNRECVLSPRFVRASMFPFIGLLLAALWCDALRLPGTTAQSTDAKCQEAFTWVFSYVALVTLSEHRSLSFCRLLTAFPQMTNTIGQDPCLVAAYLFFACDGVANSKSELQHARPSSLSTYPSRYS